MLQHCKAEINMEHGFGWSIPFFFWAARCLSSTYYPAHTKGPKLESNGPLSILLWTSPHNMRCSAAEMKIFSIYEVGEAVPFHSTKNFEKFCSLLELSLCCKKKGLPPITCFVSTICGKRGTNDSRVVVRHTH